MDDGDVELVVLAEVVGAEHDVLGPEGEEGGQPLLDADHLLHRCFVKPLSFAFFPRKINGRKVIGALF